MDCTIETEDENRKRLRYLPFMIRKSLEFLVLVCVFSSLYSYLYSGVPYYGLLLFSLFARALDRKCMFLVCNGILAFLVKNSMRGGGGKITELPPVLEEATVCGNVLTENQEVEDDGVMDKEFEDDEDGRGVIEVDVTTSAEELNKKCEEFIRKMKDEIRIEAQQQLLVV